MKFKGYKIWDNKAKHWVNDAMGRDVAFPTLQQAEDYKDSLLDKGNYPDEPHTVFDVRAVEIKNLITGI